MKTTHIIQLIELLAEKEGQLTDHYGFGKMSESIDHDDISQRYLDDLYRNMKKKQKNNQDVARPRIYLLDIIARHVGYSGFKQFSLSCETPLSGVLKACLGNWWSFVRSNAGEFLLKAPVEIKLDPKKQKVFLNLKGKERNFSGEITESGGCLSGMIESGTDKRLALIFKLGNSTRIELIQGVFCGMSSAGDPISGREILLREPNLAYENMYWGQYSIHDETIDPRIRAYFLEYHKNCIKITGVSSFDFNDLDI